MAVTVTVGTNSYISVADATTYFATRLYSTAWTSASADEMAQAVITATRAIDRQLLKGRKYVSTQALAFPRCYTVDPQAVSEYTSNTRLTWGDGWYCESAVPQAVKDACCEEAICLLERGDSNRLKTQREGLTNASGNGVTETYAPYAGKGILSQEAKELMRRYLVGSVNIT